MGATRLLTTALTILACGAALLGCREPATPGAQGKPRELVVGFVPSVQVDKLMEAADPLMELLEQETGLKFRSERTTSYIMLVEALGAGECDVAWLPPLAYVFAHERYDAEVAFMVVRDGKPSYRGQIIAGADSGIETLADIKGRTFAFTNPNSASGYLYPMTMLRRAGLDIENDFQKVQLEAHDAVIRNVASGDFDAGATYEGAEDKVASEDPTVRDKIRIIAFTEEIPADTVTYAAGLPQEMRDKISTALLKIASTEEGAKVLMDIYEIEGLEAATDADFEPVREMVASLDVDILERLKKYR